MKHLNPVQFFGPQPNDPRRFGQVVVTNPDGSPVKNDEPEVTSLPEDLAGDQDETNEVDQEASVTELAGKRVPKT